MLSDSKIMTKTSVGRLVKVEIMRYNIARKAFSCIYVSGDSVNVRMTLGSRDEKKMGALQRESMASRRRGRSRERCTE